MENKIQWQYCFCEINVRHWIFALVTKLMPSCVTKCAHIRASTIFLISLKKFFIAFLYEIILFIVYRYRPIWKILYVHVHRPPLSYDIVETRNFTKHFLGGFPKLKNQNCLTNPSLFRNNMQNPSKLQFTFSK